MPYDGEEQEILTHILVHVEGFHIFKGQVPILIVLNQLLVAAKWGAPCENHKDECHICSPTYAPASLTTHFLHARYLMPIRLLRSRGQDC